ncbi:MAG: hypothetical protein ACR2II_01875 [Chthoniobacterales bacterium]
MADSPSFGKVAICSGHVIDAPGRETPRFPEEKAALVGQKIAALLGGWSIGEGDLAICGGACGSDLLFAEESLKCGARIRLLLAQPVDQFVSDSVQHAGEDWVRRFHSLREQAEVAILPEEPGAVPNEYSIYARTNLWIIESAQAEAGNPDKIYALLIWDEKPTGDGAGGTSDFQQKVYQLGATLQIINPTRLP